MKTKKIMMTTSLKISGHGLRNTGDIWSPPFFLGEQLCYQKVAIPVGVASEPSRKKPQRKGG